MVISQFYRPYLLRFPLSLLLCSLPSPLSVSALLTSFGLLPYLFRFSLSLLLFFILLFRLFTHYVTLAILSSLLSFLLCSSYFPFSYSLIPPFFPSLHSTRPSCYSLFLPFFPSLLLFVPLSYSLTPPFFLSLLTLPFFPFLPSFPLLTFPSRLLQDGGSDAPLGRVFVQDPDDWDLEDKEFEWSGPPHPLFTLRPDGALFASSQIREGRCVG